LEIKEIVKPGEEAAPKKTQKKKAAVGGKS
jgi:hypothetical protein